LDLRCGTSNGNRNNNTGAVTILVSPTSAFVASGGPQQFKATVDNASNPAVTWQVNGVESGNATTGTITSSGLYTAPGAAGRVTVWKSKKSKMSNRLTFEFAVEVRKSTTRELQASRQSSWLLSLQLQHESSSVLFVGMENGCGGRSLSLSFRMESTTDGSRIPRLAEFARIKTNSSGLITPKAGWSIRLSQSSLVDETGIEPATSSLRTRRSPS
jgi:hypothetical protein